MSEDKIRSIRSGQARVSTAVELSFYSKLNRVFASKLGRGTTIDGDPDSTSGAKGDLRGEVFFDTFTLGLRRWRHDMLDTMVGSVAYLLTQ